MNSHRDHGIKQSCGLRLPGFYSSIYALRDYWTVQRACVEVGVADRLSSEETTEYDRLAHSSRLLRQSFPRASTCVRSHTLLKTVMDGKTATRTGVGRHSNSASTQAAARALREAWRRAVVAHGSLEEAKRPCGTPLKISHAYALLELLQHNGPLTVSQLAGCLAIDRSNVSRLCIRMEEAGEIERQEHSEDARACALSLTKAGRKLARKVDESSTEHFFELSQRLGSSSTQVIQALRLLQQAMTETKDPI